MSFEEGLLALVLGIVTASAAAVLKKKEDPPLPTIGAIGVGEMFIESRLICLRVDGIFDVADVAYL